MNLILIGFMGSGKTTIGKLLSEKLSSHFLDMDEIICEETKMVTMQNLFSLKGEIFLREREIAFARKWFLEKNLVISTGGGVVLNKIILDYFKKGEAQVIYLKAQIPTLLNRLNNDQTRPLFKDVDSFKKLYDFRSSLYLEYADGVIEVDSFSVEEIVQNIEEKFVGV